MSGYLIQVSCLRVDCKRDDTQELVLKMEEYLCLAKSGLTAENEMQLQEMMDIIAAESQTKALV